MRALRFHAAGDLRVEEVEEPPVTSGTAKVRVGHCGICGSDVEEFRRGPVVLPRPGRRHPLTGAEPPLTLGHEIAGELVELGRGARADIELGALVAIDPLLSCGECGPCRAGTPHLCRVGGAVGLAADGGFAEFVVVAADRLHPLAAGMTSAEGALVEPLAVGRHGLARGGFEEGGSVLVVGAGPIGLGVLAAARAMGAGQAVVAVRRPGRRAELARLLGADAVVGEGGATEVREALAGEEFDLVVDAAGGAASLETALRAVRRGGVIVDLALWDGPARVNPNRLLAREVSWVGSMAYAGEFPLVIAAMARGALGPVEAMVSRVVGLEDAIADGFVPLSEDGSEDVKILVAP